MSHGQFETAVERREPEMVRCAKISECGKYRYSLYREWDAKLPIVGWLLLNPSTADASVDDPTIRRLVGFSKAWGYGGMSVRNLFALRSPDPKALFADPAPVGPENDRAILEMTGQCHPIIAAWGAHGSHLGRAAAVCRALEGVGVTLKCLGINKDGSPAHPLYLKATAVLRPWP